MLRFHPGKHKHAVRIRCFSQYAGHSACSRPAVSSSRGTSQWKLGTTTLQSFTFVSEYSSLLGSMTRLFGFIPCLDLAVYYQMKFWLFSDPVHLALWPEMGVPWGGIVMRQTRVRRRWTCSMIFGPGLHEIAGMMLDALCTCPHIFEKLEILETSRQKSPFYLFSLKANLG